MVETFLNDLINQWVDKNNRDDNTDKCI